jgi:hypothetical protein
MTLSIVAIPLVFAIVGILLYAPWTPTSNKVTEIGRITFFCGLLVLVFLLAHEKL